MGSVAEAMPIGKVVVGGKIEAKELQIRVQE